MVERKIKSFTQLSKRVKHEKDISILENSILQKREGIYDSAHRVCDDVPVRIRAGW